MLITLAILAIISLITGRNILSKKHKGDKNKKH